MPRKRVWHDVVLGLPSRPDEQRGVAALEEVGLGHRAEVWPKVLSGGEARRTSLARALVREPDLLLLDEPFSATRLKAQQLVASCGSGTAARSCWSPTTSRRRCCSPTARCSCTRAASATTRS